MHILVSNDDGYNAPGLLILADALRNQHHRVTVVAPRDNKSGCGMGLSLRKSIEVEQYSDDVFIVDGTPADCVYIGLGNLVKEPVSLVVSGINNGPNLADDILYSGTFAAAMEARRLALPSIAVSVPQRNVDHYETAAYLAVQMVNAMPHLSYRTLLAVLNVNVPDLPIGELRGIKSTVLGEREAPQACSLEHATANKKYFRLGSAGEFRAVKRNKVQDFEALADSYVSVTPLSATLEDSSHVDDVQQWLDTF